MLEAAFVSDVEAAISVVAKLARLYGSDAADADDIRQEILLQAWRAYPSFELRSGFSTWLFDMALQHWRTCLPRLDTHPVSP